MNIWFFETIVEDWDISFIRGRFCYWFENKNYDECISLDKEYVDEPFTKDYMDKFLYKFLYYFKDMDYIIWFNIWDWINILLKQIEKCSQSEKFKIIFHCDFKVIDLNNVENRSSFFNDVWEQWTGLCDYPYKTTLNKSEILSNIFKTFWWKFIASSYHDTTLLEKWKITFNEEYIEDKTEQPNINEPSLNTINNRPKIKNHFKLLRFWCRASWRLEDTNSEDSRFILEKWSYWDTHASYKKDRELREALKKHKKIEYDDLYMNVLDDIFFSSPKLAADFLYWNSKWENSDWIDDNLNPIDVDDYSKYGDIEESDNMIQNSFSVEGEEEQEIKKENSEVIEEINEDENSEDLINEWEIYYLKKNNTDAEWMFIDDDSWNWKCFVVLKGSLWDKYLTNSFKAKNSLMSKRTEYKNNKFTCDRVNIILTDDIIFKSPQEASCFMQWTTSWKKTDWLDSEWNSLSDIDLKLMSSSSPDKSKWIPEEMEELTEEQALYFVNLWLDRLCFNKLKEITSWIAKILATFRWSYLWFPSLEKISTWQACILCRWFKWRELDLSSITKLYEYLSYYLALFEGEILNLSWLTSVTKDLKLLLANSKCKTIILKWIKYLTVDEFEELKSNDLEVVLSGDIYTKYSKKTEKNLKEKCVRWIPHTSFNWESARHLAGFNWDVLEVWIDWGSFRYDSLRELIKFKWDYLIVSWFDELEEDQEKILVQFGWTKLWVHWKLTNKQKEFFNWYNWKIITYSDDERRALEEELQYGDVDNYESDWDFDEDDVFDFNSKSVLREENEDECLRIIWDHLTNELAERYSNYDWDVLELELRHLNNVQVKFLSCFKWETLIISWIESISDDQAKSLSHFQWKILKLPSVIRLSDKQQAYLNHFNGDKLELPSLYQ